MTAPGPVDTPRQSAPGGRFRLGAGHVLAIQGALAVAVLAQAATGRLASWGDAAPILLGLFAFVGVLVLPVRVANRVLVLVLLGAATVAAASLVVGLPGVLGEDHSFYALKATITTPIGDHNELAGWLLVGLALAAAVRTRRTTALTILALGLGATLSRGAVVAGFVGLGAAWLAGLDRDLLGRMLRGLLIAGFVVVGAVILLDTSAPPDGPENSAAARVGLWEVALDDVGAEPLLGVGVGGFEATADEVTGPHHHAHNGTLHSVAELGLLFGLLAAARLPMAAWLLVRHGRARWAHGVALAAIVLLAHDQVEALALRGLYEVIVGALLAIGVRQATNRPRVPSTP